MIDAPDLNRQLLYGKQDIGRKKVEVALEKLKSLGLPTTIIAHDQQIDPDFFLPEGVDGVLDEPSGSGIVQRQCGMLTVPLPTPIALSTNIPTQTPIPHIATPLLFTRNMYLTDPRLEGEDVFRVQLKLQSLGYSEVGIADGIFGALTDQAVRNFQRDNGLQVDGIIGQKTWDKLFGSEER